MAQASTNKGLGREAASIEFRPDNLSAHSMLRQSEKALGSVQAWSDLFAPGWGSGAHAHCSFRLVLPIIATAQQKVTKSITEALILA